MAFEKVVAVFLALTVCIASIEAGALSRKRSASIFDGELVSDQVRSDYRFYFVLLSHGVVFSGGAGVGYHKELYRPTAPIPLSHFFQMKFTNMTIFADIVAARVSWSFWHDPTHFQQLSYIGRVNPYLRGGLDGAVDSDVECGLTMR